MKDMKVVNLRALGRNEENYEHEENARTKLIDKNNKMMNINQMQ
jgi:hypothetical protein